VLKLKKKRCESLFLRNKVPRCLVTEITVQRFTENNVPVMEKCRNDHYHEYAHDRSLSNHDHIHGLGNGHERVYCKSHGNGNGKGNGHSNGNGKGNGHSNGYGEVTVNKSRHATVTSY
jgi:hypothetical protein